jgi:hypothetical protein
MENAVVTEIYGKHDDGRRFFSQIRVGHFIKAKSSATSDTGDRMN